MTTNDLKIHIRIAQDSLGMIITPVLPKSKIRLTYMLKQLRIKQRAVGGILK